MTGCGSPFMLPRLTPRPPTRCRLQHPWTSCPWATTSDLVIVGIWDIPYLSHQSSLSFLYPFLISGRGFWRLSRRSFLSSYRNTGWRFRDLRTCVTWSESATNVSRRCYFSGRSRALLRPTISDGLETALRLSGISMKLRLMMNQCV